MKFLIYIKNFFIKNWRLLFIFIFSFLCFEFFAYNINFQDPKSMYGFSHAIKMGQIPYAEFNIISTPLYFFVMSLGLFVFDNYLIFIIEQSILVTVLFYFLFKIFDKKAWIFLLSISINYFYGISPTYNFFCFFNMIIVWYLEQKYPENDILIGFFIGLAILSKHTVGSMLLIPMFLICFKSIKKLLKRLLGIFIPCFVFLIYLLLNHALFDFINLSLLGIYDFGVENTSLKGKLFFMSFILLLIMFFLTIKNKDKKYNYYLLCGYFFTFPLYDLNHYSMFFNCFMIFILDFINIKREKSVAIICMVISVIYGIMSFFASFIDYGLPTFYKDFKHFNYILGYKSDYDSNKKINKFLNTYSNKKYFIMSGGATMFYDIISDNKLNYYDVLLYGNHGYKGTEKMINEIKKLNDVYFIVDMKTYYEAPKCTQINKRIMKYVIDNYEVVDKKYVFNVYYKP